MTSTSMLTPGAATTSWKGWLRVAAAFIVAVAFLTVAFSVGRSTASVQRITTVVVRPSVSVPAPGTVVDGCRTGRPPC